MHCLFRGRRLGGLWWSQAVVYTQTAQCTLYYTLCLLYTLLTHTWRTFLGCFGPTEGLNSEGLKLSTIDMFIIIEGHFLVKRLETSLETCLLSRSTSNVRLPVPKVLQFQILSGRLACLVKFCCHALIAPSSLSLLQELG